MHSQNIRPLKPLVILSLAIHAGCGGSSGDSAVVSPATPPSSSGTVTLSWSAPTLNMDGSYLTDLAGYNIYYGTREGEYTLHVSFDNPGISSYVVTNLAPSTYYFVATSVNAEGIESPYSGVVTKTIQ